MTTPAPLVSPRIAIIGLGYVGLPLAVELGKHFDTLGFDINPQRITELTAGEDRTHETSAGELAPSAPEDLNWPKMPDGMEIKRPPAAYRPSRPPTPGSCRAFQARSS